MALRALRHWRSLASPSAKIFDRRGSPAPATWSRAFATSSTIPECSDPTIKSALKQLYAINWYDIDGKTTRIVEEALSTANKGNADHAALENSWSSARAVEEFYGTLEALRKSIDDLMGLAGENTGSLPDKHQRALEAVHTKYMKYLSSFGDDEIYLKKKVELELGSMLVLLKQRVSGLPPKWGDVGLLGTSGLSGSYIEQRSEFR